ncbi:MAG: DUF222 domain-containing protein [Pseudonocardia sp.]
MHTTSVAPVDSTAAEEVPARVPTGRSPQPVAAARSSSAERDALPVPVEQLPTTALESELVGLAGHLAAAHCRWLRLLAEFDTREGWAGPGLRSCAHWLGWRVGMSLRTGAEQLRVAHALTTLPGITGAFAAGRVSYSKVRAMTRIATPATEKALLDIALAGTTSHVERVVRHARQAGALPAGAASLRHLDWRWNDDGTLTIRARLTAEQGAALVAAVRAAERRAHLAGAGQAADEFDGDGDGDGDGDVDGDGDGPAPAVHHGALCRSAERATEPGSAERDERSAPRPGGGSRDSAGARRADALLAVITGDHRADTELVLVVDAERATAALPGGPALPLALAERLGCGARIRALLHDRHGNPLYLGRSRRLASPGQLVALRVRDDARCRFPGCEHTRGLEAHHVIHWLRGGRTDLDNLALICPYHHQLIHDHGYQVCGRGTDLRFHRPDGTSIPQAGAPTEGDSRRLTSEYAEGITDQTITPTWGGEPLDVSAALQALLPWPRKTLAG